MTEGTPSDFLDDLDNDTKTIIDRWNTKRASLLRDRMQQEMNAKLEEFEVAIDPSLPFVKVLVRSCTAKSAPDTDPSCEEAILTIWKPTDDQLDALQEGTVLRMKNLEIKAGLFDGLLQLSGNGSTPIMTAPMSTDIGVPDCNVRTYSSIFRLHLTTKRLLKHKTQEGAPEIDVLGIILRTKDDVDGSGWSLSLIDQSKLQLRVQCRTDQRGLCSYLSSISRDFNGEAHSYRIVGLRGLRMMPFDGSENVAVALYQANSSFVEKPTCSRTKRLREWAVSDKGQQELRKAVLYKNVGVPEIARLGAKQCKAIGYIAGFSFLLNRSLIFIRVDCGGPTLHTWQFPLAAVMAFASSSGNHEDIVVLNSEEETQIMPLSSIASVLRSRQSLYCFSLQSLEGAHTENCNFEVTHISKVDTEALAALYSTFLQ